jgi:TRAP-type C4-dicarboxylate transport system permease large subunit
MNPGPAPKGGRHRIQGSSKEALGIPVNRLFKAVIPYLIPLVVALVILTYFPAVSLWLPNLLYG